MRSLSPGASCISTVGGGDESGLKALELFRFKKLTEATSGSAIKNMKSTGT